MCLKIPNGYFVGTGFGIGFGTGFCQVRDNRDRDEKTRSRRTLLVISFSYSLSPFFNLEWGLFQGSVLSPDLYLLFISDFIFLFHQYDVNFYADDSATAIVTHLGMSFLAFLSIYCTNWLVDLLLYYGRHRLIRVKHFRYLGYELNSRTSFGTFVTKLLKNIQSRTSYA